jgi:UDP-glucose 4-epimerase
MNFLITGGAGFIGSYLAEELIKLGHNVKVIDDYSADLSRYSKQTKFVEYVEADITNINTIEKEFKNIDYVFHLASDARIQMSVDHPLKSAEINAMGTANVLNLSRKYNVKRVIYTSTSSLYKDQNKLLNSEIDEIEPKTAYGVSKLFGENMMKLYSKVYNLDTVILRLFNVYGDGELDQGKYATVIGKFLLQKISLEPLTIIGDGKQRRDFTNIIDVIDALIRSALCPEPLNGEIYNVGTGHNYSILEIAQMLSENIEFIPKRIGELQYTRADNSKIFRDLGWQPKINIKDWLLTKNT